MGLIKGFLKGRRITVAVTAIITLAAVYGVYRTERHISSYKFCTSCHSMTFPDAETKKSSHFGRLGIYPECKDCHLPPRFLQRIFTHLTEGVHDTIGNFKYDLNTKEKFDKHRAAFAHIARAAMKKTDSVNCRKCHKAPNPASDYGKMQHKKIGSSGTTCIDCHQNLVHEYVPEEDIAKGIEEGRIVLR
ncbi:MAG: NapC/NirT family cytochrome c [Deltaproteobacteria bacterium]|nr:NapC/NirT family cytochrome c [Deltaproteobacteria bacterium]